jgi:hypothetical protein
MNPIRKAIKTLPGHWHQGSAFGPNNTACGLGHLHRATVKSNLDLNLYCPASKLMSDAAIDKFPERVGGEPGPGAFPNFNDHPETTEDEVIAVMELAADRWDLEHEG